ncbi:MAG: TrkA family potassium uptake protein [Lachnospiraceae bacterium]|nr:TrkA family potassium uptake protein [Lachnospiraceae bacterium]
MKTVLVIGMGRLGSYLARRMQDLGNEVMIVDQNEELIQELSPEFSDCYSGDCTNEGVLRSLGVNNFDYCFVTIGENAYDSLEITSMLKELGAKHVIVNARKERQEKFLKSVGADEVIFPEKEYAEKLAIRYNSDNIFDYEDLTADYGIFEISILSEWVGKSIVALGIAKNYNVNILAIKRDEKMFPMPGGDYVFCEGDHVVVLGANQDVYKIVQFRGKHSKNV